MALPRSTPGGLSSHVRTSSLNAYSVAGAGSSSTQVSALQARIQQKKTELESVRQLRDLAVGLADQMEQLERKLATLSDGTEAVATVLANWHSVLRAVYMASAKLPKAKSDPDGEHTEPAAPALPQTLMILEHTDEGRKPDAGGFFSGKMLSDF